MSSKAQPTSINVALTKDELEALHSTASQMRDNMDYYNYMQKKEHKRFCEAYTKAMQKLTEAKSKLS